MSTTTDNTGNVPWKPLVSQRWSLEHRGFVQKEDGEVPHRTEPFPPAFTEVESVTQNERDVHKTRRIVEKLAPATVVDKTLGTAWGELQRFASSWTHEKDMLPGGDLTAGSFYIVVNETATHNPANFKRELIYVSAWEPRTRREYDDELGMYVTITETVVENDINGEPPLPSGEPNGLAWEEIREVDFWRSISSVHILEKAYYKLSYETIQYTFPALFLGFSFLETFEDGNERTVFKVSPIVRTAFSVPVHARVVEELVSSADAVALFDPTENPTPFGSNAGMPDEDTLLSGDLGTNEMRARLFNPKPTDISYSGLMVELHAPNVLTDRWDEDEPPLMQHMYFSTLPGDTYYGHPKNELIKVEPTAITASEYLALAAEPLAKTVCIQDDLTQWKHGGYKRRRMVIQLQ